MRKIYIVVRQCESSEGPDFPITELDSAWFDQAKAEGRKDELNAVASVRRGQWPNGYIVAAVESVEIRDAE